MRYFSRAAKQATPQKSMLSLYVRLNSNKCAPALRETVNYIQGAAQILRMPIQKKLIKFFLALP